MGHSPSPLPLSHLAETERHPFSLSQIKRIADRHLLLNLPSAVGTLTNVCFSQQGMLLLPPLSDVLERVLGLGAPLQNQKLLQLGNPQHPLQHSRQQITTKRYLLPLYRLTPESL